MPDHLQSNSLGPPNEIDFEILLNPGVGSLQSTALVSQSQVKSRPLVVLTHAVWGQPSFRLPMWGHHLEDAEKLDDVDVAKLIQHIHLGGSTWGERL